MTWDEIEGGITIEDFQITDVPDRVRDRGDLWKPMLAKQGRFRLADML